MIIERKDNNITIITRERATTAEMALRMEEAYNSFKNDNVVVDLSSFEVLILENILHFLPISNKHRGQRHSFVLVSNAIDLDKIPDEMIFVPTIQEAYDIIEMEEMERDLGF